MSGRLPMPEEVEDFLRWIAELANDDFCDEGEPGEGPCLCCGRYVPQGLVDGWAVVCCVCLTEGMSDVR